MGNRHNYINLNIDLKTEKERERDEIQRGRERYSSEIDFQTERVSEKNRQTDRQRYSEI